MWLPLAPVLLQPWALVMLTVKERRERKEDRLIPGAPHQMKSLQKCQFPLISSFSVSSWSQLPLTSAGLCQDMPPWNVRLPARVRVCRREHNLLSRYPCIDRTACCCQQWFCEHKCTHRTHKQNYSKAKTFVILFWGVRVKNSKNKKPLIFTKAVVFV